MNTKTMEGLVGARTNMDLLNTPFRVYKEAERKGDIGTMGKAMEFMGEFSNKAKEYKAEVNEGMKEDAKTAREKAKAEREKVLQKQREEREKLENVREEKQDEKKEMDTITISEEGRALLKESTITSEKSDNNGNTEFDEFCSLKEKGDFFV